MMKIKDLHFLFKKRELSPLELLQDLLKKIKKEDKEYHSFLFLTEELAFSLAKSAEKEILKGDFHPLCGVPLSVKDNILIKGEKCTAGSKILENYIASYDATVIKKIKEKKGVILGKTNLDEFAMGSSTENSAFFVTKNPWDKTKVPGGSSGGSATAVAKEFCFYSLASDTGGSIRQPASFCNVFGLKPTYGTVSRFGLISMASSLDQIGVIANSVEDLEIVFEAISGKDPLDQTTVDFSFKKEKISSLKGLKFAFLKEAFEKEVDDEIKKNFNEFLEKIKKEGAKIKEVSFESFRYALACYYIIMTAEASANLARYDGERFGKKISGLDFFEEISKTRGKYLGKEVKRRIILGSFVLSKGYFEDYYLKAQKIRNFIRKEFEKTLQEFDFLLMPTSPILPFKIGERINDPLLMYLCDIFTVPLNLSGFCGISMPSSRGKKISPGIQVIGGPFKEGKVFAVGKILETLI